MELVEDAQRFRLTRLAGEDAAADGADVIEGLSTEPKTLPCKYLYDATGSALFERICETPEYYPTRTEREILLDSSGEIAALTGPCEVVELGSGSASKTRILLEAYAEQEAEVHFAPIDVSETILRESSRELVSRFDSLSIRGFSGTYEQALAALHPAPVPARMFVFLGSTIGNFSNRGRAAFTRQIRGAMAAGEYLLVGIDRVKDPGVIEAAYNDSQGLTARFNLNVLEHLNRRFDGDFAVAAFAHRAFYDRSRKRVEMHLVSGQEQEATLGGLQLRTSLAAGESIRSEISKKFEPHALAEEFSGHGFDHVCTWSDAREWFSLMLFRLENGANGAETDATG